MTSLSIPDQLHQRLAEAANERGERVDLLVAHALETYLDQMEPVSPPAGAHELQNASKPDWRQELLALAETAYAEYTAAGGQPLDTDGIEQEVADRRGGSYRKEEA